MQLRTFYNTKYMQNGRKANKYYFKIPSEIIIENYY